MCRIVESACCSFCKQEMGTISHLFWHCDTVQLFQAKFKTTLNESCENCFEPICTETLVLFGVKENVVTDRVIDLIILLAKYYIFLCKLQGSTPITKIFIKSLKQRYIVEKYASLVCNRNHSFNLEWLPYLKLTQADQLRKHCIVTMIMGNILQFILPMFACYIVLFGCVHAGGWVICIMLLDVIYWVLFTEFNFKVCIMSIDIV